MTLSDHIAIGIPPDPDQRILNQCAYQGEKAPGQKRLLGELTRCTARESDVPLVVVAAGGKLTVLCPFHYRLLAGLG